MVVNDLNKKYTSYFYFSHLTRMILHWKHGYNNYVIYLMMNPFVPSAPFLYPPRNIRKRYVFQFSGVNWIHWEQMDSIWKVYTCDQLYKEML